MTCAWAEPAPANLRACTQYGASWLAHRRRRRQARRLGVCPMSHEAIERALELAAFA